LLLRLLFVVAVGCLYIGTLGFLLRCPILFPLFLAENAFILFFSTFLGTNAAVLPEQRMRSNTDISDVVDATTTDGGVEEREEEESV
jgi:hypothetical protein